MPIITDGGEGGASSAAVGARMRFAADTPYSAWTDPIGWDTTVYDTAGFWHAATSSFRIPAGLAGLYLVTGIVYVSAAVGLTAVDGVAASDSDLNNDFQVRFDRDSATLFGSFSCTQRLHVGDDCVVQLSPQGGYAGALPDILGGTGNSYFALQRLSDLPV